MSTGCSFSGDKAVGSWSRPLTSSNAVPCMPLWLEMGQPWRLLGWRTSLLDSWAISRRFSFTRFSQHRRVRWLQMNCFVGGNVTQCGDVMTSALKMETAGFSVSSVHIYQTTRRCIKWRLFYDVMSYNIYLLQLGFHTVAAVGRLYRNRKETAMYRRGNNKPNNTKAQNTQNRKQTYQPKTNTQTILTHSLPTI